MTVSVIHVIPDEAILPWNIFHRRMESAKNKASLLLPLAMFYYLLLPVVLSPVLYGLYDLLKKNTRGYKTLRDFPTPPETLPVFGNLYHVLSHQARFHDWMLDECKRQDEKPWRLQMLTNTFLVTTSSEQWHDILHTHADTLGKGDILRIQTEDFIGQSFFVLNGHGWAAQRKQASHLFSMKMLRDHMQVVVRQHTETLCNRLTEYQRSDTPMDIAEIMMLLTMDVFTEIGFGVNLQGLEKGDMNRALGDAFNRQAYATMRRSRQPVWLWKLTKWLNIGPEAQGTKDRQMIDSFAREIIAKCMADKSKVDGEERSGKKDLIQLFLEKGEMDAETIRDISLTFIVASRETTAHTMTWFLIYMNRYPEVAALIRREIQRELPELASGQVCVPTMEQAQRLTYLEATIKEVLRLNPAAPMLSRTALEDTVLSDGTLLYKGDRLLLSVYALHRMKGEWGEDAEEFRPDRWIDPETGKLIYVPSTKFAAFFSGPRTCIGQKLAMLELQLVLSAIMARFSIETMKDPFSYTYTLAIVLAVRGKVEAKVKSAAY